MQTQKSKLELSYTTLGIIVGIIGIIHGAGELLKGDILITENYTTALPDGWPNQNFAKDLQGNPVFSILTGVPFYVLGLLSITISTTMIVYSARIKKINANTIFFFTLISLGIFLFGAGQGTPIAVCLPLIIFGIISLNMKPKARSKESKKRLLTIFNWSYWLQISSWILFFPILFVLSFYQPIPKALLMYDFWIMPISILALGISGLMYDQSNNLK